MRPTGIFAAAALLLASVSAQDAAAPRPIAIKVKRAITVSGAPIDDAVILIEGGRISAVGAADAVDVPFEADVIEAGDLWATPGFVHPAALAMGPSGAYDVSGKNNSADKLAFDDLVPTWPGVRVLAKAGYTRANVVVVNGGFAGQSVLVKPAKKLDRPIRKDDVVVTRDLALCMAFEPRTTNKTFWKETLAKAKTFREARAGKGGAKPESAPASRPASETKPSDETRPASQPAQDPKITPIADVLDSKMPGVMVIPGAAALLHFVPIAKEFPEFKPALLVTGDDSWRIVDDVKGLSWPVILSTERVFKPDTIVELVPVRDFVDAGVAVALIPENPFTQGYGGFVFHLSELVRRGVAREVVLRAVTLTPAEMLGIQKDVGSLEKGKAGDVLLWTADPLSPEAALARVIVGGVTVHERKDEP